MAQGAKEMNEELGLWLVPAIIGLYLFIELFDLFRGF